MSERLIDFAKQLADEEIQALRAEIKRLRLTDAERARAQRVSACKRLFGAGKDRLR